MAYTDRLKEARKNKGLSQQDLARLLGIGSSTVSGYETGIRDPSMKTLHQMMEILEIDANYLFQDEMTAEQKAAHLADDERELIDGYHALNDINKGIVIKVIRYLRDSEDMEVIIQRAKEWKD